MIKMLGRGIMIRRNRIEIGSNGIKMMKFFESGTGWRGREKVKGI